jgi:hypothetical protein
MPKPSAKLGVLFALALAWPFFTTAFAIADLADFSAHMDRNMLAFWGISLLAVLPMCFALAQLMPAEWNEDFRCALALLVSGAIVSIEVFIGTFIFVMFAFEHGYMG